MNIHEFVIGRRGFLAGSTALAAGAVLAGGARLDAQAHSAEAHSMPAGSPIPVAFLLDEGATMIDFSGPWEVFQDAGVAGVAGFDLFTVAPTAKPFRTSGGLQVIADYTLDNAPPARVIVVPAQAGGRDPTKGAGKVEWLKARHSDTELIMSVCTGAFLLARTGLLDGQDATTHHDYFDEFSNQFPKVRLQKGRRFVDNGRLMSAGGLSSGIDGALHVVERFYGPAALKKVAEYMEYSSPRLDQARM